MFGDILNAIKAVTTINFEDGSTLLEDCVNEDADFINTLRQIGTIPEFIAHDSTEENCSQRHQMQFCPAHFEKLV